MLVFDMEVSKYVLMYLIVNIDDSLGTTTTTTTIIISEGGTEEDRRIDPPLNFGTFKENNNKIWKKWLQSSPR